MAGQSGHCARLCRSSRKYAACQPHCVLAESVGERLINRRSTTYKQLDEAQRDALSGDAAAELLREHPTLIKRPVLVWQDTISVGFSEQDFAARFNV